MIKSFVVAAVAAVVLATAGSALAAGEGGHFWLQKNHAYAKAHPIKGGYVCRVPGKNYMVVKPAPCAPGLAD